MRCTETARETVVCLCVCVYLTVPQAYFSYIKGDVSKEFGPCPMQLACNLHLIEI